MISHDVLMNRGIALANFGNGNTAPNPMVGCVIVHNGIIIGEGYHEMYGKAHAEPNAITSVKNQALLQESTLYVNLEPCAHWGKTPPCTEIIIEKKIPRVIVGCVDTYSKVAGKGIEQLRKAGVEVTVGVLEQECRDLNKRFFTFHEKHRPYIYLKWAQTLDGFIDIKRTSLLEAKPMNITDELCRRLVHKWRSQEAAVMVGTNTALLDDPSLTTRVWPGKNAVRIVIDKQLRLPNTLHLFDQSVKTFVFTQKEVNNKPNLTYITLPEITIEAMLQALFHHKIQSVIVEGGAQLLQSFIDAGVWDDAGVFIGSQSIGSGVRAPVLQQSYYKQETWGNSQLLLYKKG